MLENMPGASRRAMIENRRNSTYNTQRDAAMGIPPSEYQNPNVFNNGDIIGLTNTNPMQRNQHFKPESKRMGIIMNTMTP